VNDETMKFGLLLESAQSHQKLVEENLERLKAHTQDLDGIVREEIRRTLIDELQAVTTETRLAAQALKIMRRGATLKTASWHIAVSVVCAVVPTTVLWWCLPSPSKIAALRTQREELTSSLAQLERQGARIEWRRCGEARRLCVRVDRGSVAYGESADFMIVKGY
jgi:hypothetical protein